MKSPLYLAALLGAGACATADSASTRSPTSPVLERITEAGELRVGLSGNQPPFNMKDKDGRLVGLDVDVVSAMALSMGVKLRFVEMPFKELLPALESGKVDIVVSGLTITPRRNMRVAFVGPYVVSGKSVLTQSERLEADATLGDLDRSDMKVVVLAGSTSESFARRAFPRARIETADAYDGAVQMVLSEQADAFVADRPILVVTMMKNPDEDLRISNTPLTIEPIGIAVSAGDPLWLNFLQNTLGAMEAAGLLADFEQRWFLDASWIDQVRFNSKSEASSESAD